MVHVRCPNFDDGVWAYVVEYANMRGFDRCQALQEIVKEHIKFVAPRKDYDARIPDLLKVLAGAGIGAIAGYFLGKISSPTGIERQRQPDNCPRCQRKISKWSRHCPHCNLSLT